VAYVPAGFIVGWPGASAIPSGWERASELDDVHPKGAAASADPGSSGGSATHEHTSPTHSHTIGSHQHVGGTSGVSGAVNIGDLGDQGLTVADTTHNHTNPTSGAATGNLATAAATWGTATNDPPYYTVRWIRSLGTTQGIPDGAWGYWDAAALPSGWSSPAAVRLKYLKGAAAGGNGGSTGGSSSAHSHAAVAHTHGIEAHSHSGGATGANNQTDQTQATGSGLATNGHTHLAAFTPSSGSTSGSATSASSGSTTAEVPYVKLGIVQNDNGAVSLPVGIIGLWLGLLTALPGSLLLCDGAGGTQDTRGKYVKGADISAGSFTGIGGTGGAATHDHTDPASHTHSAEHTHPVTYGASSSGGGMAGALMVGHTATHTHSNGTSGSAGGTSGSGTQTVSDASHDPPYRTVVFVKFTGTIDVTVSSPTEAQGLTSPSLTVAWSLSAGTQSSKRIRIYAADQSTVVYDSGVIANSTASYDLPGAAGLRTGKTYYVRVSVENNSGVPGDSSLVSFTTAWTPPSVLSGMTARVIGGV